MLEDSLMNLKWKCCTQNEKLIEINGCRSNDNIDNVEYESNTIKIQVDSNLVDIIEEIYYVMALENIDSNENKMDKDKLLSQLQQTEEYYNILLRLKQLYYTEVQTSIERINAYCEHGESVTQKDIFLLKNIEIFYMELRNKFFEEDWDYIFRNLEYGLFHKNLRVWKKFVNALIDLEICYENNDMREKNKVIIKRWIKLFLVLREKEFGIGGEIAWLLCLLNIFQKVCLDSNCFEWVNTVHWEAHWEAHLSKMIERTNRMVENVFEKKICDTQKGMMNFLIRAMPSDIFDSKISLLVSALKQIPEVNKYWIKKQDKCIAIMHSNSKCYVALSGVKYANDYSKVIKQILGEGYEVVELNNNVRYYHTKHTYITYKDYKDWKENAKFDEKKVPEAARMFSCCERKLLTKLYGKQNVNYTIYVKMNACPMCRVALIDYDKKESSRGLIKYPIKHKTTKAGRKRKSMGEKLNQIARCVSKGEIYS